MSSLKSSKVHQCLLSNKVGHVLLQDMRNNFVYLNQNQESESGLLDKYVFTDKEFGTILWWLSEIIFILELPSPSLTRCFLSVRKLVIHWQMTLLVEVWWRGFPELLLISWTEVSKQNSCICPWVVLQDVVQPHVHRIIHWPVCSVSKLSCAISQEGQISAAQRTSWWQMSEQQACSHLILWWRVS